MNTIIKTINDVHEFLFSSLEEFQTFQTVHSSVKRLYSSCSSCYCCCSIPIVHFVLLNIVSYYTPCQLVPSRLHFSYVPWLYDLD